MQLRGKSAIKNYPISGKFLKMTYEIVLRGSKVLADHEFLVVIILALKRYKNFKKIKIERFGPQSKLLSLRPEIDQLYRF